MNETEREEKAKKLSVELEMKEQKNSRLLVSPSELFCLKVSLSHTGSLFSLFWFVFPPFFLVTLTNQPTSLIRIIKDTN